MYCKTRGGLGGGPGRGLPVRAQTVSDVVVHMLEKTEAVIFTVFSLQKLLYVRFQNKSGFCVCILYVIRIQSGGVEMPLTKNSSVPHPRKTPLFSTQKDVTCRPGRKCKFADCWKIV